MVLLLLTVGGSYCVYMHTSAGVHVCGCLCGCLCRVTDYFFFFTAKSSWQLLRVYAYQRTYVCTQTHGHAPHTEQVFGIHLYLHIQTSWTPHGTGCLAFCAMYVLTALSTRSSSLRVLVLGRILGAFVSSHVCGLICALICAHICEKSLTCVFVLRILGVVVPVCVSLSLSLSLCACSFPSLTPYKQIRGNGNVAAFFRS